jgi:hypothetical protein
MYGQSGLPNTFSLDEGKLTGQFIAHSQDRSEYAPLGVVKREGAIEEGLS